MELILNLLLMFIIFSICDHFVIKWEVKQNIDLFYDLHKNQIDKILLKEGINNDKKI